MKQYDSLDIDHFVISTFTGRLYRHLTHANTNFDKNHFESQDYMSCVDKLSRLNPCYFNICLLSRIKTIEETLNEDEFFNSTRESEMQTTRFYMERLNEGAIQKIFLSKMAKKQTIYDQTFDSLIKFCCLGCGNIESNFEIFIKSILHPFIEYFSDRYLPEM